MIREGFEDLGEHGGLHRFKGQPREGTTDWVLVGPLGAIQFTRYGDHPDWPQETLERMHAHGMGYDFGIHWPRGSGTSEHVYGDCAFLEGGCEFTVSGATAMFISGRVDGAMEADGIDFDEAVWRVLESSYEWALAR